jgi:mTERF
MQHVRLVILLLAAWIQNRNFVSSFYAPRVYHCTRSIVSMQNDETKRYNRSNKRAKEIIGLLTSHFEVSSDVIHDIPKSFPNDMEWKKLQRFLYRVTAIPERSLTLQQTRKVLEFLDGVVVDRDAQRAIVLHSPRILTKNVQTRLRPTVDFLLSLYGTELFHVAIRRNPDLLLTSGTGYDGDNLDLVEVFLQQDLNLSRKSIGLLKKSHPQFFMLSMVQLLSVVSFLRSVLEPQTNTDCTADDSRRATKVIGKLVQTHPMIFHLSVEENLKPRLRFLQERCCFRDHDLASLIKSSSGSILGLSVSDNLSPTIDLLSTLLSVSELRKSLFSHPQILGLSLENLRTKIDFFHKIDQLDPSWDPKRISLASRVLMKAPAVYSLSLPGNIVPTVQFLARIWGQPTLEEEEEQANLEPLDHPVGTSKHETHSLLGTLLRECPTILSMSLHGNIQPTVYFYARAGYIVLDDDDRLQPFPDGTMTVIRGRYITASLFTRLLPRWHYCQQKSGGDAFVAPPLYILAGTTDEAFCSRYGYDISDYAKFKETEIPRLKFSSQFETWIHTGKAIDPL